MAMLTPPPINFQQRIRSALAEALQLNYGDIFPTVLHMRVTMAVGSSPQVDTYRTPGDYSLVIGEIRAHLAMNALGDEGEQIGVAGTGLLQMPGMQNRVMAKAMNARVSLVNADRDNLKLIENDIANTSSPLGTFGTLALSTLMPVAGGSPIRLIADGDVMPFLVPANERLRMTVSINDDVTAGLPTEYGLVLMGAFVRSRGS